MPKYPSVSPTDALSILARNPSLSNVGARFAELTPTYGRTPSAYQMRTDQGVSEIAQEAYGTSPAMRALNDQAANERRQDRVAQEEADADFAAHGLERGLLRAGVGNQIADVNSEAAAGRTFLPFASAQRDRLLQDMLAKADVQYGNPARVKAAADLESARIAAEARQRAAEVQYEPSFERIMGQRFAGGHNLTDPSTNIWQRLFGSQRPTADSIEQLRKLLKPGETVTLPVPRPMGY